MGKNVMVITIIGVIVVVLLFYLLEANKQEKFTPDEIRFNMSDIRLVIERFVKDVNGLLVPDIVTPCMDSSNVVTIEDKIRCISTYKHYYGQVLEDPIATMLQYMDNLDILPFDYNDYNKQKQQIHATTVAIVSAFSKALTEELNYLASVYQVFGYDPETFIGRFGQTLADHVSEKLIDIMLDPNNITADQSDHPIHPDHPIQP